MMRWTQNKAFCYLESRPMKIPREFHLDNQKSLFCVHRILIFVIHTHFVRRAKVQLFCSPNAQKQGEIFVEMESHWRHGYMHLRNVHSRVWKEPGVHVSIHYKTAHSVLACSREWRLSNKAMWETTFPRNSHAGLGRPVYEPNILASMLASS